MNGSGFAEFDRLTELFVRARDVLERVVREHDLPREASDFLAAAVLPHVELVEEGFRVSLRASGVDLAELRWFVLAAGVGLPVSEGSASRAAAAEDSLQQRVRPPRVTRPTGNELAAIDHARIVFALLPHLPNQEARWPMRWPHAGYGDVDPPRRPSELAARIEELERHVWWTAAGRPSLDDPAYRRTFGFFDTAAWLGSRIIGGAA
ncbi:MAG TPA: hypothetical protein VJ141_03755 [Candidatus Limnocylindrales bacterium]|nr:hypothetical protein [Candidatus Limnocylindrales bacterium]